MDDINKPDPPLDLNLLTLRIIRVLGKGATGTVFLVSGQNSDDHPLFALKVIDKSTNHRHADRRARHEISILSRFPSHPFLPHLIAASEDHDFIFYGIPYCSGGDLNALRHRQNDGVFSPAVIRFYLAEIICALEYLHEHGIVYRDLKPENVLIQHSGHVTLTDFDLSRDLGAVAPCKTSHQMTTPTPVTRPMVRITMTNMLKKSKTARVSPATKRNPTEETSGRTNSFVGTEEYLSPEVIRGDGHEFAVDWWSLGILAYEMMYGKTPLKGRNRKETFKRILVAEPEFMGKPNELTELITKLLEKDPTRRLGYGGGASEIKRQGFFKGLRWDLLTEVLRPPFLPLGEETEVTAGGFGGVREYFEKLKMPPPPLWSPSVEERQDNDVLLTEF